MRQFLIYNTTTDEIHCIEHRADNSEPLPEEGYASIEIENALHIGCYWMDAGILKTRKKCPSNFHHWIDGEWVLDNQAYTESIQASVRSKRNSLLAESDWTDTLSAKERLGEVAFLQWHEYRQALRDIPNQSGFPLQVEWPTSPI